MKTGTYVCIEGPRFSSKAESKLYHQWGADVVGMTLGSGMRFSPWKPKSATQTYPTVTDYDVWKDHVVCVDDILATMKKNVESVRQIIAQTVAKMPAECSCPCGQALKGAFV